MKGLQREEGVDADAEHLRLRAIEPRQRVAERAQLLGADRAEGRRKERQHHRAAARGAQRHRLPLMIRQREVRRSRSDLCWHASSLAHRPAGRALPTAYLALLCSIRIAFLVGAVAHGRLIYPSHQEFLT